MSRRLMFSIPRRAWGPTVRRGAKRMQSVRLGRRHGTVADGTAPARSRCGSRAEMQCMYKPRVLLCHIHASSQHRIPPYLCPLVCAAEPSQTSGCMCRPVLVHAQRRPEWRARLFVGYRTVPTARSLTVLVCVWFPRPMHSPLAAGVCGQVFVGWMPWHCRRVGGQGPIAGGMARWMRASGKCSNS